MGISPWLWALLALLILSGLAYWFLGKPPQQLMTTAPQVTQPAPTVQPKLALSNTAGEVTYSGVVGDERTRNGVIDALRSVFGETNISGDIAVDPNAAPAPWLANLRQALEKLKIPGVEALFQGHTICLGGLLSKADLDQLKASLQSILGTGFSFASISDSASSLYAGAKERAIGALAALKPGFSDGDLVSALNLAIINFDTGSDTISPASHDLLEQAAAAIKSAPAGTVIEIGGHTDATGIRRPTRYCRSSGRMLCGLR